MDFDLPGEVQILVAAARAFREERLDPLEPKGVSIFLVDSGAPGYEVVRTMPTMGDAWEPCELAFQDCRLPADALLEPENGGLEIADHQLRHGRIEIGSYQLDIELAQRVTHRCPPAFGGRGHARNSPVQSSRQVVGQ